MSERSRLRLFLLHVLVLSLLLTLFGRLWYMQVLAGDKYAAAATVTTTRDIVTAAPRGGILDEWGRPLATNRAMLVVSVDRVTLDKQKDKGVAVLHRLATVLHQRYRTLAHRVRYCYEVHDERPCWAGSPYQPIPVTALDAGVDANTRTALMIAERQSEFPGVTAQLQGVRNYPEPLRANAAHLLGYLGPISQAELQAAAFKDYQPTDRVGRAGIESVYERYLRGRDGVRTMSIDRFGHVSGTVRDRAAQPGDNLVLSLDAGVQRVLERSLADAIRRAPTADPRNPVHPRTAAGVVVDARTGHIVAMASYPSYDPNIWNGTVTQAQYDRLQRGNKLLGLSYQGEYAPGSTFKLVSTSAIVDTEHLASWYGSYSCPSSIDVGGRTFHNSEGEAKGVISLRQTIQYSCDTVYYNFARNEYATDYRRVVREHKKPVEAVVRMAQAYGMGAASGIDLPGEATGMIIGWEGKQQLGTYYHQQFCDGAHGYTDSKGVQHPPQADPKRRAEDEQRCDHPDRGDTLFLPGDQVNMDIGQGTVLVTPLQNAMAYAALVNGGRVYSPRIAKAVVSPDGKVVRRIDAPVRRRLPVKRSTLDGIRQAMYDVTQAKGGTGYTAFKGFPFAKVAVGGKTGTAQKLHHSDTSWFASFAGPPGKPAQFVTMIVVPYGGFGAAVAAPAAREVWDGIYGLEGRTAALPQGLNRRLPRFNPDGTVATKGPAGSRTLPPKPGKAGASPSPSPSVTALGPLGPVRPVAPAGGGWPGDLPAALPAAEPAGSARLAAGSARLAADVGWRPWTATGGRSP
ncbi:MAG: penicillin-binding transpeptidase domain-containing protein [Frankiaceae bacterium]